MLIEHSYFVFYRSNFGDYIIEAHFNSPNKLNTNLSPGFNFMAICL
jgi:hypothetical protein